MDKTVNALGKLYTQAQKILDVLMVVLLTGMVVIVFSNVISRYFLDASLAWSEEISRFMMIWLAFIGAVAAYVNDEHLALDMLVNVLPRKIAGIIAVVADLLILFVLYMMIIGGYEITVSSWAWLSPASETRYGLIYLIVPICATIMFLQTVAKIIRHVKSLSGLFEAGAKRGM